MTGPTHLIGAIASLALPIGLMTLAGTPPTLDLTGAMALGAMLGALLPDLDAEESQIKNVTVALDTAPGRRKRSADFWTVTPFVPLAALLHPLLGHRTLTHSLLGIALFTALVVVPIGAFLSPVGAVGLLLGYASHLLLDACTPHGVPLLYPDSKRFHCLPRSLWIPTGSRQEVRLFLALAVLALGALFLVLAQTAR